MINVKVIHIKLILNNKIYSIIKYNRVKTFRQLKKDIYKRLNSKFYNGIDIFIHYLLILFYFIQTL